MFDAVIDVPSEETNDSGFPKPANAVALQMYIVLVEYMSAWVTTCAKPGKINTVTVIKLIKCGYRKNLNKCTYY